MSSDTPQPNICLSYQRKLRRWTQEHVADKLYALCTEAELEEHGIVDKNMVSKWERGLHTPGFYWQNKLCELFERNAEELGFVEPPKIPASFHTSTLPRISSTWTGIPNALSNADGETDADTKELSDRRRSEVSRPPREDWGEAPHVEQLYGRNEELVKLRQWIVTDHCHVVAILGIGGIGKTSLAVAVTRDVKDTFTAVFWRSLQNAPPLDSLLRDCIAFVSDQKRMDLPEEREGQISLLMKYLRERRCLLILDNFETVLQGGKGAGSSRAGYEGYGKLLQRLGEADHQSCLLLTSREKPQEVAFLEGEASPVRSHRLEGLNLISGRAILRDKGLRGEEQTWEALVNHYGGNPLSLKLVAQFIREVFDGDIAGFLAGGELLFSDVRAVLDQQFERLSGVEQEIMYWLAIEREAIALTVIEENSVPPVARRELQEALRSLRRRDLVETSITGMTLQNVVMEYMVDRFIDQVCEEISSGVCALFESHALMKAQAKDYIRESQARLILKPVVQRLLTTLGKEGVANTLKSFLSRQRKMYPRRSTYVAGNVLNLLVQSGYDLRGYDFSSLVVRQAYLQGAILPEVNFAYANLERSVFTDTFGSILSAAFSPDGNLLAAGTSNSEVRLWQGTSGILVRTFQEHTDWVRSVVFSPDGSIIASSSNDQTVRLWQVSSGQCLQVLRGHIHRVWSVAFSPDGRIVASGGDDQVIRLWEVSSGRCLKTLPGHTHRINSVVFSPDGRTLASGSEDQTVRLWEIDSGRCLKMLHGHTGWIRSIAFSPDGHTVVSGSGDQTVRLWEVSSGQCLKVLQGHTGWVYSVAFSPDGHTIASGSGDQTVRVWEVSGGQCLKMLQGHAGWVRSTAFSPDGSTVVSGSEDQTIRLWEVSSGRCLKTLQGYSKRIHALSLSSDGSAVASGGDDLCIWETSSGRCLKMLHGHFSWVYSVAFSPDGRALASSSSDQTVRVWEVSSGQCLKTLQGHSKCVWSVAFSPEGSTIASSSNDETVRVWEVSSGRCLKVLHGHAGWVYTVAFSPDGSMLASSGDDQVIRLWEVSSGRCLQVLRGHINRIWSVAFSLDGSMLASGGDDQTVRLWAARSGRCLKELQGHTGWIRSVAFSSDGNTVVSGSEDQTVRVWEVSSGQCLKVLQGHSSSVRSIASAGNLVASGSDDGTAKLWHTQTWECLKTLRSARPYEGMNITAMTGVTQAQKAILKTLGAHEEGEEIERRDGPRGGSSST